MGLSPGKPVTWRRGLCVLSNRPVTTVSLSKFYGDMASDAAAPSSLTHAVGKLLMNRGRLGTGLPLMPMKRWCSCSPVVADKTSSGLPQVSKSSQETAVQSFLFRYVQKRSKMTKSQAYRRAPTASPHGRSYPPHIGMKRLSAEFVNMNQMLVRQRKVVPFNPTPTKFRHFKFYPGENTRVTKNTSIISTCIGRVKYTHDVHRQVLLVNILPEKREELLRSDLWRYRTEHVRSVEENRHLCMLRTKCTRAFQKELVNPPTKPPPRRKSLSRFDAWENPSLPDVVNLE